MPANQHQMPLQQSQAFQDQGLHLQTQDMPLSNSQDTDIDDSGIGMSLVDDDLALSKFGLAAGSHVGLGMMGGEIGVDVL